MKVGSGRSNRPARFDRQTPGASLPGQERPMKFGIGQSVKRSEDLRFVTGQGQYTDDLHFAGETHAVFLRSPHAHAMIGGIDSAAALTMPGVVAVLTHKDVEAAGAGEMPCL